MATRSLDLHRGRSRHLYTFWPAMANSILIGLLFLASYVSHCTAFQVYKHSNMIQLMCSYPSPGSLLSVFSSIQSTSFLVEASGTGTLSATATMYADAGRLPRPLPSCLLSSGSFPRSLYVPSPPDADSQGLMLMTSQGIWFTFRKRDSTEGTTRRRWGRNRGADAA